MDGASILALAAADGVRIVPVDGRRPGVYVLHPRLGPLVVVNRAAGARRRASVVAHELGHHLTGTALVGHQGRVAAHEAIADGVGCGLLAALAVRP